MYRSSIGLSTLVLFGICVFHTAEGYGSGAPAGACVTMVPGHTGTSAQPSNTNPYTVSASSATYTPGGTVTVTITGGDFQGMLLQARRVGETTPVGTFSNPPTDTKLTQCTNADDSVTHENTNTKNGLTFTWNAPSQGVGEIEFLATVAQQKSTYWTAFSSGQVTEDGGSSATTEDGGSSATTVHSKTNIGNTDSAVTTGTHVTNTPDQVTRDNEAVDTTTRDPNNIGAGSRVTQFLSYLLLAAIAAIFSC